MPQQERGVEVRVTDDLEALSREAAADVARRTEEAARHDRVSVALSGGTTPRRLYELLASEPYRTRVPWARLHVFLVDERCVPPDHPDSNFRMIHATLLSRVAVPAAHLHPIPVDHGDPPSVASAYEHTLRTFFQSDGEGGSSFDVVVLGLGEDGHTASLFPGSPAISEATRWVTSTIGGIPRLPRITLTIPALTRAKHLVWVVAGTRKASVLREVLEGANQGRELPARQVRPRQGTSLWCVDRDASARLDRTLRIGRAR